MRPILINFPYCTSNLSTGTTRKHSNRKHGWLERFQQYVKLVYEIDVDMMITVITEVKVKKSLDKEIITQEDSLWTLGRTAIHEMTVSDFGENTTKLNLLGIITVFTKYFAPSQTFLITAVQRSSGRNNNRTKHSNIIGTIYANWKKIVIPKTYHSFN